MDCFFEMHNISKRYFGVKVLNDVDFQLERGEIRALLGANGAGKSTLIKIMCGIQSATKGLIKIDGEPVAISSPLVAQHLGIAVVPQELDLVPTLTVLQNIYLGRELTRRGLLDEKAMRAAYRKICKEYHFTLPHDAIIRDLSTAQQQMVAIMKALSFDARILVMDEPTTSLTFREKERIFEIILDLKKRGKTIVYISHIMEEIFTLADRATILRNGCKVGTFEVEHLTYASISEYMSGIPIVRSEHQRTSCVHDTTPALEVIGLCNRKKVNNVNFSVQPGEVVGLAGLVGSGRTEIVRTIFGADVKTAGTVKVMGKEVHVTCPHDAIKNGIGLITEDRKSQGLVLQHSVCQNATLVKACSSQKSFILDSATERDGTKSAVQKLSIKVNSIFDMVSGLSGGNQQKVVLAKWLMIEEKVLIFDEPTRGIDIGAKECVFQVVDELASNGVGVIFISSDLEEVLRVSDRILIICGGTVIKEVKNQGVSVKDILQIVLQQ